MLWRRCSFAGSVLAKQRRLRKFGAVETHAAVHLLRSSRSITAFAISDSRRSSAAALARVVSRARRSMQDEYIDTIRARNIAAEKVSSPLVFACCRHTRSGVGLG